MNGTFKALALAAQFGFAVAAPMVVFIGGGVWLDNKLGTGHILFLIGLVLGVLSAGAALFQLATSQSSGSPTRKAAQKSTKITDQNADDPGTTPANKERNNS